MVEGRQLAAVVFTDLQGFTSDTHRDESGSLRLLAEQDALVGPIVAAHGGRRVKSMGDGLLLLFPNARDALGCAVAVQQAVHEHNSREGVLPLRMRTGIHLGDVELRGTDVLGDAVNIASRIEPLADIGGICLTAQVYDQVRNKVPFTLESVGAKTLRGIPEPVEVFRVALPWAPSEAPAPDETVPRLAVLPFANISPDPNDAYLADGLTEELITALSHIKRLRVIARTSVAQYRATTKSVSQIGKELRVNSVLEGSVRKAGNQLRVTVQLIDAAREEHLWATTYDRDVGNVFAVQAEIAQEVAEALKVRVDRREVARLVGRPAVLPESYLEYLRGIAGLDPTSRDAVEFARRQFELAIRLDARNAAAYAGLADVTRFRGWYFAGVARASWEAESRRLIAQALEIDPNLAEAHGSQALVCWDNADYAGAETEFRRALDLNPGQALVHLAYAGLLLDELRTDEALREYAFAETLAPRSADVLRLHALALIWLRRLDEAGALIDRLRELGNDFSTYGLAAEYCLARSDKKRAVLELRAGEKAASTPRERTLYGAWASVVEGDSQSAREILQREEAIMETSSMICLDVAYLWAEMDDLDQFYRWVEKGLKLGPIPMQQMRNDPALAKVRADPRFSVLLEKLKVPDGPRAVGRGA